MKYKVFLSNQASKDLRGIFQYIGVNLQSPENAVRQIRRLEEHIRSLDKLPYRFRKYETGHWKKRNLRVMPVDHYCVFYIPNDDEKTVTVVRIMYGGRNIDRWMENATVKED